MPFLNGLLGTFPLTLEDWVIVASVALTISPVLEVAKWMARRAWIGSMGS
jgi:Ca2+-transporting ATPase